MAVFISLAVREWDEIPFKGSQIVNYKKITLYNYVLVFVHASIVPFFTQILAKLHFSADYLLLSVTIRLHRWPVFISVKTGISNMEHENLHITDLRKQSHLELAQAAQNALLDERFYYEPMLAAHPDKTGEWPTQLGDKTLRFPFWISSMTGGTARARSINKMLAQTARKFGLGMGLGSCRIILENDTHLADFDLRPILGDEVPFYANVGIAQAERLLENKQTNLLKKLVDKLNVDGLIIHVNPLQEWLQAEGDTIHVAPLFTIQKLLNEINIPLIVKEVGQGFGPQSMESLLQLPLAAIEFGAAGGTNFSKLELARNNIMQSYYEAVIHAGHSATEMVGFLNEAVDKLGDKRKCGTVIISGGIKNFLDGYYLISKSKLNACYGQASAFLQQANISQEALDEYARHQAEGLLLARTFLKIK